MLIKQILFSDERLTRDNMSFYIVEPTAGTQRTVNLYGSGYTGINYELPETNFVVSVTWAGSEFTRQIRWPNGKVYWSSSTYTDKTTINKILPKGMYFWCENSSYGITTITYADDCIFEIPKEYIEANLIE